MNLSGNTILVTMGDTELACQLESTFTSTSNLTANPPCKGESKAETQSVTSRSWSITFNGKTQNGAVASPSNDQRALLAAQKSGELVEVVFAPKPELNPDATSNWTITGNARVSEVTINAPVDGESTYSGTFTGDGDWTEADVPVAP